MATFFARIMGTKMVINEKVFQADNHILKDHNKSTKFTSF